MSLAESTSSSSAHPTHAHITEPAVLEAITVKIAKAGKDARVLPRNTNQALGLAQYAIDFCVKGEGNPDEAVYERVEAFHTDSVACGLSAIALRTNAPTVLREEALEYARNPGAKIFGSRKKVATEKAILANCSAVREWDSNGTVFGFNGKFGKDHMAGEFGHNDFYPVAVAACQAQGLDGLKALRAMLCIDEIRGRLAEVFSLKTFHIDHVVHGAIASAAVYGALVGATAEQIESAIGMVVAHYIPFRAIRAGEQLSDSKGASAAISTEVAIMSIHRCMKGFVGPADIFRNPEAIWRKFKPTQKTEVGDSPFDLVLGLNGSDFAVMGMHFKLGLYEHQSAGALQGMMNLLSQHTHLLEQGAISSIKVVAYQPAFGIIGDPAKRNPATRQSADHSMVYILSRLLLKAQQHKDAVVTAVKNEGLSGDQRSDELWKLLMLLPHDYARSAIADESTRKLMHLISFEHGGPEYDSKYPEGIPTSIVITDTKGESFDSKLIMFPAGHAANKTANLKEILDVKFKRLMDLAVGEEGQAAAIGKLAKLKGKSAKEIDQLYDFDIQLLETKAASASKPKGKSKRARGAAAPEEKEADEEPAPLPEF